MIRFYFAISWKWNIGYKFGLEHEPYTFINKMVRLNMDVFIIIFGYLVIGPFHFSCETLDY